MFPTVFCSNFGGIVINVHKQKNLRPGIVEVAEAAKVSTATVDRVLNNRGGVREATARRVTEAAVKLGYIFETREETHSEKKQIVVSFLLPDGSNPYLHFLTRLITSGEAVPPTCNIRCDCHPVKRFDASSLATAIRVHATKADTIALMGLEHPLVREAINEVSRKGTSVVTIITDVSHCNRAAFVGLDNRAVGRTAAYLMSRFCRRTDGDIALIAGSLSYLAHNEREMGFLSYMQETLPGLNIVGAREGHDDFEENYQLTKSLLKQYPDLVGIYNSGGSSGGVARALREAGKSGSLVFIGHGLTEDTRNMLLDGTIDIVISQDPLAIVHNVCQVASTITRGITSLENIPNLSMQIICRENLP